ncbi:RNA polymerase sigma factor [Actinokineospora iranica]|uniref:RNA polymerase sigma factor n=1 Tax=Actinokineospora iranica TaxID=1271860 RepID=UPI000B81589D|nr:RNA polymerase sigma factor [Actinokineospora iranica]
MREPSARWVRAAPPATESDALLWARAAEGDQDAFGELFQRHVAAVWNYGYRLTGSWERAEDLTSTVFLTAWRRRRSVILVRESALPWLFTVMGNAVRDETRGMRRRLMLARRVGTPDDVADHAESVASRVDGDLSIRRIAEMVAGLPVAQRRVVQLCLFGELPQAQAAEILGVTVVTVRSNLSRARARLRQLMEGQA